MNRLTKRIWLSRIASLLFVLLLGACASTPSFYRAPFEFALLGDTPYSDADVVRLDQVIDQINTAQPAFVVHLGDITAGRGPCSDAWLEARKLQFTRFQAPFVLTPGDNDWTDCHRTGFDPLERLEKMRVLFHGAPPTALCAAQQSGAYTEHVRWQAGGAVFVTINVPGSNNNLGRTPAADAEHYARMPQVLRWLSEAVQAASAADVHSLFVMFQANPDFEGTYPPPKGAPDGFASLRAALIQHAQTLGKPLIVVHGDTHAFKHDRPVAAAPNLVRIEVDGWPTVGWLRIGLGPGSTLQIERHRLP